MIDMANNKVQLGDGTVLMDLTSDTVSPSTLKRGITAHNASGESITGTMDEGGGGGTEHYVIEGRYTADDSGNITITQIDSLDAATILEGHLDEVYCRLLGTLGGLSFHATHAATSTGVYNMACRTDKAFYILAITQYLSTEQIPEAAYYVTIEVQGVTMYAAFTVSKIDAVDENDAYIVINTETQDGEVVITGVTHDSVDKISALASNGKLERIHVVVNNDSGYTVLHGYTANNSTLVFVCSMANAFGSYNIVLNISILPSAPETQDGVYVEEVEFDGNTIYVCYEINSDIGYFAQVARTGSYNDLTNKPTIPTVPTISTDIPADAASDAKTASPKAVKTFVENKGYATEQYVTQAIAGIANFSFQILGSGEYDASGKPTITGATNKIYLVPKTSGRDNVYAEWLYVGSDFELIGSTTVDMSGYVMASELDDVAFSGDYGDLDNTPTIPTVPAISTDITTDAASDAKTASPKAVKTYIDNQGYVNANGVRGIIEDEVEGGYLIGSSSPVSFLTNDVGYQTASQVQSAIDAAVPGNLVTGKNASNVDTPYIIKVSSSAPASGTANNIITIVV